jgi:DNA-binding LytR/AlgR family response regulator
MKSIQIGGRTTVNPEDVVLLTASVNYTIVHYADGKKTIVATPLKTLEPRFLPYEFYRTHKSFLVNINYVKNFMDRTNLLELSNNQMIMVSRRKRDGLKRWLIDR